MLINLRDTNRLSIELGNRGYLTKIENWIFFDFIEKERNNILKEFSFGAELPKAEDGRTLAYGKTCHDAAQLFREAVYWWRHELEKIEALV